MDWKLISLMLRDHDDGRGRFTTSFTLSNTIKLFGQDTEFDEVKEKLRPLYKELSEALDENNKEIEGKISDERFTQIVNIVKDLLDDYYISQRFDN